MSSDRETTLREALDKLLTEVVKVESFAQAWQPLSNGDIADLRRAATVARKILASTPPASVPVEPSGWQDISTAPKDGTRIDVWLGDGDAEDIEFYCAKGSRRSTDWHWKSGRFRPAMGLQIPVVTVRPTHWMPLPSPPLSLSEDT